MAKLQEEWDSATPIKVDLQSEWDSAQPLRRVGDTSPSTDTSDKPGFLTGVGRGLAKTVGGVGQRLGVYSQSDIDAAMSAMEEERKQSTTGGKIGEIIGEAAPYATIPGGTAVSLPLRMATGALSGAAVSAMQPTKTGESVLENAAVGGMLGGAGTAVMGGLSKVGNAVADRLPINSIRDLAKKWGIRTTLGEDTSNPLIQKAETLLEQVPIIGLKNFRLKQQKETEQAAKSWFAQYVYDPSTVGNFQMARQANRDYASGLFDDLNSLVKTVGTPNIAPTETQAAATGLLKRYPDIFKKFQDKEREGIIRDVVGGVGDNPDPFAVLSNLYNMPSTASKKTLTYEEFNTLRKGLGEMIGQARKSPEVDHTALAQLSKLYGAINNDFDRWVAKVNRPDIKEALTTANEAYKQYVVRFDTLDDIMAKALGERGAGEMFSPKKLSTDIKNIVWKNQKTKEFPESQIQEMTGLANIMQVVKRAGQFAENPPTGNRWGLPVMAGTIGAGAATVGIANTAATVTPVLIARFLTGSESGKRLAMAASKIEPNTPAMKNFMNIIYNQVPKWAALYGTED
jgi:hypothetical protein